MGFIAKGELKMVSGKGINKQWNDIWIEKDGIHMLKVAYDSLFNNKKEKLNAPEYIKDDYIISFDNITKIEKMYYKGRRVMLVSLKDTKKQFEVTVKNFQDYRIIKQNLMTKTVGTKRKFALAAAITIAIVLSSNVNYNKLVNNLIESAKNVDLQKTDVMLNIK